jgi:hypothetical protein
MENDPLDQIYVKTEQVEGEQRALLAKLIFPYASVNPDTGDVHFKTTADELNAKQKILLYLLCRLALSTRPGTTFGAEVSPKEVERATMLPGGTVRPYLSDLVKSRAVVKSGEAYSVPAALLPRAAKLMPTTSNE